MRLLHPRTIEILASHPEFPKTHLANAWSEVFKFLASEQKHPKMFIADHYDLGQYLGYLYATATNCNLNKDVILKKNSSIINGFNNYQKLKPKYFTTYFDSNYLFSDACSLYYKGINIFPDIFGDEWRKMVPVESLNEIKRQVDKTINKQQYANKL